MKKCSQCGEEKEDTQFYKDKRLLDGLRSNCKVCQNKKRNDWRKRNPESVKKSLKKFYENHKELWKIRESNFSEDQREKKRKHSSEYYYANKDELLQKRRGKYKNIPKEKRVAYSQKYYDANKEKICDRNRIAFQSLSPEQKKAKVERTKLWRQNNKAKMQAWSAVGNAIIRGDIEKPSQCSKCKSQEKLHGHHEDYEKQLDVIWLCHSCHMGLHAHEKRTK